MQAENRKIIAVFEYINNQLIVGFNNNEVFEIAPGKLNHLLPQSIGYFYLSQLAFDDEKIILCKHQIIITIEQVLTYGKLLPAAVASDFSITLNTGTLKRNDYWVETILSIFPFRPFEFIGFGEFYGHGSSECGGFSYKNPHEINEYSDKEFLDSCQATQLLELVERYNGNDMMIKKAILSSVYKQKGIDAKNDWH